MSNRELRVSSFLLVVLVVGAACSSGSASSGGSSTTSTTAGGTTSSSSSTIPEGFATLAARMLTNVPRGLALQPDKIADTGATNLDKAIQDAVAPNAAEVLRGAGFVAGYQRSWAGADLAQHDVVFLYQFASAAGAARYVTDRVSELEAANAGLTISRFAVLIAGAVGLHSEGPDSSFGVVVFSKGVYAVEALSTDASKDDQSLAAAALAEAQNQRLP
ncbi:MAG: hypothetical protein M3Q30_21160 [Actinomycetota bacterium]|nr:hypothetical protein [Actinomycetota bacterium]